MFRRLGMPTEAAHDKSRLWPRPGGFAKQDIFDDQSRDRRLRQGIGRRARRGSKVKQAASDTASNLTDHVKDLLDQQEGR